MAWGGDGSLWSSPLNDRARGIARVGPTGEVTYPFGTALVGFSLQQVLPGDRYGLAVRSPIGTAFGPAFVVDLASGETTPLLGVDVVELRYTSGLLVYVLNNGSLEARAIRPAHAPHQRFARSCSRRTSPSPTAGRRSSRSRPTAPWRTCPTRRAPSCSSIAPASRASPSARVATSTSPGSRPMAGAC